MTLAACSYCILNRVPPQQICQFPLLPSDECDYWQIKCASDGICLDERSKCDGRADCADASDEANCNSGRVTNSILYCWHFTIKDQWKKCIFIQQILIKVCVCCFWLVSLDTSAPWRHSWLCPCIFLVPRATQKASRGPLKGAVFAQRSPPRARDGDGGVAGRKKREYCFPKRGHRFFLQANQ